ncbi:glycoside hydrolase family 16 protein [Pholiota molesta]|nr:glycoside hydrolase family 16 protein [Pholiota molesta]
MIRALPLSFLFLISFIRVVGGFELTNSSLPTTWPSDFPILAKRDSFEQNPDGTSFVWLPFDEYLGKTFYDRWNFYDGPDPTRYVNRTTALANRLVYIQNDGKVIMKADNTTKLAKGVYRERLHIIAHHRTGLSELIVVLFKPVWPAFWTFGDDWPNNGEIDIIEGVHDNEHNQVAFHTADGCHLNSSTDITGTIQLTSTGKNQTNCYALINDNAGCGITEWRGGIFAMKWDENDISVWSFYRAAIPVDVTAGSPTPSAWGIPSAKLDSSMCNISKFFSNHSIIFGDWAGNSYATSGCPGTCEERLMDPANFANATWSINSLKIYTKQNLTGRITADSSSVVIILPFKSLVWLWLLFGLLFV